MAMVVRSVQLGLGLDFTLMNSHSSCRRLGEFSTILAMFSGVSGIGSGIGRGGRPALRFLSTI